MTTEQYTVRIYDRNLVKKVEDTFKNCKDVYPTKNPFIVDCISRGAEAIEKDLLGAKKIESLQDLFDEIHLTVEKLNQLLKLCEKNARQILANLTVNQKLLSCNYNMLLGISQDVPKKKEFVENGVYDDLPARLSEYLEEVLRAILK